MLGPEENRDCSGAPGGRSLPAAGSCAGFPPGAGQDRATLAALFSLNMLVGTEQGASYSEPEYDAGFARRASWRSAECGFRSRPDDGRDSRFMKKTHPDSAFVFGDGFGRGHVRVLRNAHHRPRQGLLPGAFRHRHGALTTPVFLQEAADRPTSSSILTAGICIPAIQSWNTRQTRRLGQRLRHRSSHGAAYVAQPAAQLRRRPSYVSFDRTSTTCSSPTIRAGTSPPGR